MAKRIRPEQAAWARRYYREWVAAPYERPCKNCQKPTLAFGRRCDSCQAKYQSALRKKHRAHYRAKETLRREQLREYQRSVRERTPCADCGQRFPWYVMEFDHPLGRNGAPLIGFIRYMSRLKAEIAKCEVVCGNCHNTRTHMRAVAAGTRK
jgi:hypothetical protein